MDGRRSDDGNISLHRDPRRFGGAHNIRQLENSFEVVSCSNNTLSINVAKSQRLEGYNTRWGNQQWQFLRVKRISSNMDDEEDEDDYDGKSDTSLSNDNNKDEFER
ncbi:hypothetical protein L1887_31748 [Cichorium endivia]|nr:hypothetical protein L1887_31748 [Cichorium endivia]